jgi:hypothetical protein
VYDGCGQKRLTFFTTFHQRHFSFTHISERVIGHSFNPVPGSLHFVATTPSFEETCHCLPTKRNGSNSSISRPIGLYFEFHWCSFFQRLSPVSLYTLAFKRKLHFLNEKTRRALQDLLFILESNYCLNKLKKNLFTNNMSISYTVSSGLLSFFL